MGSFMKKIKMFRDTDHQLLAKGSIISCLEKGQGHESQVFLSPAPPTPIREPLEKVTKMIHNIPQEKGRAPSVRTEQRGKRPTRGPESSPWSCLANDWEEKSLHVSGPAPDDDK